MIISKDLFAILFIIDKFSTIQHRKKLQKIIFILKEKLNYGITFKFIPYLYGPYSFELEDSINKLVTDGIIKEKLTKGNIREYSYSLTPLGKNVLEQMKKLIDKESVKKLKQVTDMCSNKTTLEIVSIAKNIMSKQ